MELAIILMMLLIVVALGAIKLSDGGMAFPFRRKPQLFTQVECSFLTLIEQAVGREFRVMCRVRLNDMVTVRQSTKKKTATQAVSRASSRQLDFVLVEKDTMSPVLAIDLVHNQGKDGYKTQKDWFVTGALDAAGVPHVRIKVKSGYSVEDIRECLENKLVPYRRLQQKMAQQPTLNPEPTKRPTRPIRSSRPAAA
ncbi:MULTISPECIES: DUF2726 domain-containing protein [Alteromonas]|jgi:hypothetical protein|uniref:DUF2726 domain-containing protein n=1 Tax=Alteromonas hispanica TaxID=315421 RepID=A0A6L9MWL3_9ALTE|nr:MULTISPECIES: DUF2726 domain-containing protein [Alteromonas]APE06830.1 hypothetical protein BM528_14445 [Alteromonas sp. RW2A1]AUC89358.1 DUF2726 domain-containing protein [Alteromonas sp. MB-3u-76]MAI64875.1 DUF2726 domain-containing protein [Alteromonas sp.]NDW22578.1 DUF2726 domain-containing protein [Alteromonas hispanica]